MGAVSVWQVIILFLLPLGFLVLLLFMAISARSWAKRTHAEVQQLSSLVSTKLGQR